MDARFFHSGWTTALWHLHKVSRRRFRIDTHDEWRRMKGLRVADADRVMEGREHMRLVATPCLRNVALRGQTSSSNSSHRICSRVNAVPPCAACIAARFVLSATGNDQSYITYLIMDCSATCAQVHSFYECSLRPIVREWRVHCYSVIFRMIVVYYVSRARWKCIFVLDNVFSFTFLFESVLMCYYGSIILP